MNKGKTHAFLSALLALLLLTASLSGCRGDAGDSGEYDFYIFNTKGENADALQAAADAYALETDQNIKVFSLGAGTDSSEALRAEMNSDNMPTIFSIMNIQDLTQWVEGGFAMNLNDAATAEFKALHDAIPENLRLTAGGTSSYGIPYNVEGYGYITDRKMLGALFGDENTDRLITDFQNASYDEFEALVLALDAYIRSGTAADVTLSGSTYSLAADKGELSSKLTGVFATAGSQTWTYGDHMLNIAIDTVFESPAKAKDADNTQIESLRGPLLAYAEALNLKTSHAAGQNGPLARSAEFINTTTAGYDAEISLFADRKAVFLKQGNWVYTNLEKANSEIVDSLVFLPVKMPFKESDIKVAGLSVEKMNSSIPVFVPNYYAINAKATAEQRERAEKFLVWLNTTDTGRKYILEDMAFIPYNADPDTTSIPNSLGKSILMYLKAGKNITNAYAGAPTGWSGTTVGQYIMENYLTKAEWTAEDYEAIAEFAVSKWKEMK